MRRRSCGKHLAFVDIQVNVGHDIDTEETNNDAIDRKVLQVVFQRNSPAWKIEFDESFPAKNSQLPYGARISLVLQVMEKLSESRQIEDDKQPAVRYLVEQWTILEHPRELALSQAQLKDNGGVSCQLYLKSRTNAFLRFNETPREPKKIGTSIGGEPSGPLAIPEDSCSTPHGDSRAKALRAQIFASWLIERYGKSFLCHRGGVLDIAGGKGKLSIELAMQAGVPCTIVDPLVRKHGTKLDPRDAKRLCKMGAPHPQLVTKAFNTTNFLKDEGRLVGEAQLCVGLHPDECTEDILDVSIQYNIPVAIVPCCVFPGFFPIRTTRNRLTGEIQPVRTYEQFLDYLLQKDDRLRRTELPFEGRNVVVYRLP